MGKNNAVKICDESEKIEYVLDVFDEFLQDNTEIDIAQFRKSKKYLYSDGCTWAMIESGEKICELLLFAVAFEYANSHGHTLYNMPKKLIPERNKYLKKYMGKLPEYQYLLDRLDLEYE